MLDWNTSTKVLDGLRAADAESTWDDFVGWFRPPVISFARSMGLRASDAEDVAQETLLAFAKHYREGRYDRSKGRLSTWLFGIAMRQVRRARRQLGRREVNISPGENSSFWSALPDEAETTASWDAQWRDVVLRQCLEQVRREVESPTFRAFEMVVYEERTPAETATALSVTVKTVYNAKHRILKRVRELSALHEDAPIGKALHGLP